MTQTVPGQVEGRYQQPFPMKGQTVNLLGLKASSLCWNKPPPPLKRDQLQTIGHEEVGCAAIKLY